MTPSMRKILYIITDLDYGGAEMQLKELAFQMNKRGYQITILSIMIPNKDFGIFFNSSNIKVYNLGLSKGELNPFVIFKALRIIKQFRPDIIHSHLIHANLMSRFLKLFYRRSILINTVHSTYEGGKFRELIVKRTAKIPDLITIVSKRAKELYIKKALVPASKIEFIPNGIVIEKNKVLKSTKESYYRETFGTKDKFVWLAVGRLAKPKDYPNLISAVQIIAKSKKDFIVLVAGDGELLDSLANEINKAKVDQFIKFIGLRKDIRELMLFADAFVLSSAWEGLPIVLLEAASSRLPIVATNVGDNNEIIINGKNGFLVHPKDPEQLADAMTKTMKLDNQMLKSFGQSNFEIVHKKYSMDKIVDDWIIAYEKLLG